MSVDLGISKRRKGNQRRKKTIEKKKSVCNQYIMEADEVIAIKKIDEALDALDGNVDSLIRVFNFVIGQKKF